MATPQFVDLGNTAYRISSIAKVECKATSSNDPPEKAILVVTFLDGTSIVVPFPDCKTAIHTKWNITTPGWDHDGGF